MESSVEDTHLGQARHELTHGANTLQVGGVVQRSQVGALLKHAQHLVVQHNALVELLAAVHHAVTHCVDLAQVFDNTNLGVGEQREDELHALGMLGNVVHDLFFLTIGQLHFHESTVQAYALGTATGHHTLVVHVVERIFDRAATTIQN